MKPTPESHGHSHSVCPTCNQKIRSKWFYLLRTLKVALAIILFRCFRIYLSGSQEIANAVAKMPSTVTLEDAVVFFGILVMSTGVVALVALFILFGKTLWTKWFFGTIVLVSLDGVFMYFCPEIGAAILRAIFHVV